MEGHVAVTVEIIRGWVFRVDRAVELHGIVSGVSLPLDVGAVYLDSMYTQDSWFWPDHELRHAHPRCVYGPLGYYEGGGNL